MYLIILTLKQNNIIWIFCQKIWNRLSLTCEIFIWKIAIPPATLTIKAWSKISLIKRNIFPFQTGKGASEVETEESKIVKSNYSLFLLSPIVTTKTWNRWHKFIYVRSGCFDFSILISRLDKIDIILISLNTLSQFHYLVLWTLQGNQKGHPLTRNNYGSGMSFSLLNSKKDKRYYLSTIYTIPKCLNACIIASSFSGVHCGCLAFSDFGRLKFSPTSSPHFFLIYAIYSEETLSPVYSNT